MTWDDLIGQAAATQILLAAAKQPAPGYALAGPAGIGKRSLAELFAREILGLAADHTLASHPDFIRLAKIPGDQAIKVEAVRDLLEAIHRTTAMGGKRVVLIEQAEALNDSSVNVLLKDLEESKATVYLFTVERLERLPATLRSRLVTIQLKQVPRAELIPWLQRQNFDQNQATALADWSRGCPGQALAIAKSMSDWQADQRQAQDFIEVMLHRPFAEQLVMIEKVARLCDRSEDASRAWQRLFMLASQALQPQFLTLPVESARLARGLALATKSIGTSLPIRVVLEWVASEPYNGNNYLPSMLISSYL